MSQFLMPSLGADMESAILMEWLVKEGDTVTKGQVIAEVETSKGVIEIEVFEDGVVEKLLVEEETECKVGIPLAIIRSENESIEEVKEEKRVQEPHLKISPAARKRAEELGVDLKKITPKDGVIQLAQIEEKEAKREKKAASNDGMRQAIATAMSLSNTEIPHYYLSTSINMTPALNYIEELNKNRSIKDRILPVAMLIRGVVLTLKEVPQLNGFWHNDKHQMSKEIHPGIAIALRKVG
ncbi:MAG: biotin/lipoyl-containing protein [Campylobacterota bacterium]|nr:biotin/lipoyl-containing protein [Campylobacterota bacterium]